MNAKTPTGSLTVTNPTKTFTIIITDPCEQATSATVDAASIGPTSYGNGAAEITVTWGAWVVVPNLSPVNTAVCLITYTIDIPVTI
jgi:hypothetical protein